MRERPLMALGRKGNHVGQAIMALPEIAFSEKAAEYLCTAITTLSVI
jgi:hypothetical protein